LNQAKAGRLVKWNHQGGKSIDLPAISHFQWVIAVFLGQAKWGRGMLVGILPVLTTRTKGIL